MKARIRQLSVLQPLRGRDFRMVWLGETVSMLGDQFYLIALPWLALELTGSSLALGLVLMAAAIPRAGLMLVGGAMSDRFDPRSIMIASSATRAILVAALAALVWTDGLQLWHLYVLGAGFGAADAFFQPAALALVPRLVGKDQLEASNALVMGSMALTGMVGPAAAGVIIAAAGTALGFGIDAATFAFAVVTLLLIRRPPPSTSEADEAAPGGNAFHAIVDGLRYANADVQMRTVLLAVTVINLAVVGPFFVGLPALVDSFHSGPMAYGIVLSSWGGAALIGALLAGSLGERARMSTVVPTTAFAMAGALVLIGLAPNVWTTALAAAPLGAAVGVLQVSGMAWLQRRSEPAFLGRVMSLVMFAIMGLTPISYALAGAIAEIGLPVLFVGAGASVLLLAVSTAVTPVWREADRGPILTPADGLA
ncbi:MAG TPA: MFS transporter [Candidatus Limnocylindria bacterium]|nr:MFS transporter [Candidatus Limnocylindria bacterium]